MDSDKIQDQIDHFLELSEQSWEEKDYKKSIEFCKKAWGVLPDPKVNHEDSYMIVKDIIETYGLLEDWNGAKEWVPLIFDVDKSRIDDGDREFVAGKVEYELGNLEGAKTFFQTADRKSESACFDGEDPKYRSVL